jgi:alcohol dehydrogenase
MSGKQGIELELRKFVAPEFIFGVGARFMAGRYAKNFGARKVLVVSDPGVVQAGWADEVIRSLEAEGLSSALFMDVSPNPRAEEVMSGAGMYSREGCDAIIAVGGGSSMDCAKGIGIVSTNSGHILEYEGVDLVERPLPPLICIPTTAGTGADVSQFAIINDTGRRVKVAIVSKTIVPDVALIDPETTVTMDPDLTAHTGLDALTHAVEAYVSNANSPVTDTHALEAVRLIHDNLPRAVVDPADLQVRGKMMLGSLFAGLAFSNASLGLVHAMAHSLGGLLDLPHGVCNAVLLEHIVEFNYPSAAPRYRRIGRELGVRTEGMSGEEIRRALVDHFSSFRRAVGVDIRLSTMGMRPEDVAALAQTSLLDACLVTNPVQPCAEDIERIYGRAL